MFDWLYQLLGLIMRLIYNLVQNFGVSIILFTLFVRVCMLPLVLKQQKSMAHMQKIQPALKEIQEKYQYDKDKLNAETVKLYQQNKINPMGSCLPLIVQMIVLFAVYAIIQNPVTYILQTGGAGLKEAFEALMQDNSHWSQLDVSAWVSNNLTEAGNLLSGIGSAFTTDSFAMNFNFLGLNLGEKPGDMIAANQIVYWIFPLVAALSTFLTSMISQKIANKAQGGEAASQMKTMQYIFPLMTGLFCYSLPAAMGLYWIVGNILQLVQSFTLDRYVVRRESDVIEVKEELKQDVEEYKINNQMINKLKEIIKNNETEDMKNYGYEIVVDSSIVELTNQFTLTEQRVINKIRLKYGTIRIYSQDYYFNGEYITTQCFII